MKTNECNHTRFSENFLVFVSNGIYLSINGVLITLTVKKPVNPAFPIILFKFGSEIPE